VKPPDHPPLPGSSSLLFRAARRIPPRAGRSSKPPRCAKNKLNARGRCSSSSASTVARSWPPDGTVLARSLRHAEGVYETQLSDRQPVCEHCRLLTSPTSASTAVERYPQQRLERPDRHRAAVGPQPSSRAGGRAVRRSSRRSTPKPRRVAQQGARRTPGGRSSRLEPRSGAVTVMASSPELQPHNSLKSPRGPTSGSPRDSRGPLVNRATQFGYAPGSTFKVVTATAAIDSGAFTAGIDGLGAQRRP